MVTWHGHMLSPIIRTSHLTFSQVNASISFWTQIYTYPNHILKFDHSNYWFCHQLEGLLHTFIAQTAKSMVSAKSNFLPSIEVIEDEYCEYLYLVSKFVWGISYTQTQQWQQSTTVVLPQNVTCCGENTAPHGVIPAVDELSVSQTHLPGTDVTGLATCLPLVEETEDEYCEKLWIHTIFAHIGICRRETTTATTSGSKRNGQ